MTIIQKFWLVAAIDILLVGMLGLVAVYENSTVFAVAMFVVLFIFAAVLKNIPCPKCGSSIMKKRLLSAHGKDFYLSYGLPGLTCGVCGHDLSQPYKNE